MPIDNIAHEHLSWFQSLYIMYNAAIFAVLHMIPGVHKFLVYYISLVYVYVEVLMLSLTGESSSLPYNVFQVALHIHTKSKWEFLLSQPSPVPGNVILLNFS